MPKEESCIDKTIQKLRTMILDFEIERVYFPDDNNKYESKYKEATMTAIKALLEIKKRGIQI